MKDRKRPLDLMFMLGLNETMDRLAMANNVRWYDHVLRRADGPSCKVHWILRLKVRG